MTRRATKQRPINGDRLARFIGRSCVARDLSQGGQTQAINFSVGILDGCTKLNVKPLGRLDVLLALSLLALTTLYALIFFDFSLPPFEDAAMLMRYSQHVTEGYGIVWNVGEQPVDGATDFLFMLVLAALAKAGLSLEVAVRLVGLVSHWLTVLIIYVAIRTLHGASRWAAWLSAAYLAMGPGLGQIAAYFGTPFFVLSATLTCYLAHRVVKKDSRITAAMFAISGLVMGLIRPEGVFLAAFMLLGIIYLRGWTASRTITWYFVTTFAVIGGLYFFWHWNYFGYPLPNPFYRKGGGTLHLTSLRASVENTIVLCLPFLWILILALRWRKTARQALFSLMPIGSFVAIWVLLSNEINYLMRFQYAILPIVLISWPPLLEGIRERWKSFRLFALNPAGRLGLAVMVSLVVLLYSYGQFGHATYAADGRYDVALMLSQYRAKHYTIATSEAGLLAYYSNWRAVDTWGLNDQWIAHHGEISESYLDLYKPTLIVFHEFNPSMPNDRDRQWLSMVATLKGYANKNGYRLAAAFGETPSDAHAYYVRTDFPDSAEIARRIQNIHYAWYGTGNQSENFANEY